MASQRRPWDVLFQGCFSWMVVHIILCVSDVALFFFFLRNCLFEIMSLKKKVQLRWEQKKISYLFLNIVQFHKMRKPGSQRTD